MLKFENQLETRKNYRELFNIIAGVRILFLLATVFNSTVELGLSFSVLKIEDDASKILLGLFMATVINIILLIFYLKYVTESNNQTNFLFYTIEVLSLVYGILGLYAYIRYIQELEFFTVSAFIGMFGLVDLMIINIFIGSYFMQGKISERLVEFAILINLVILIILGFI